MGRKSQFSREEKISAVQLVTSGGRTVLSVANEYGVYENTVLKWKHQYKTNPEMAFSGENSETPTAETERMRRRILELENEVEFLKSVRVLCQTPAVKYALIKKHAGPLRLCQACRIMEVRRQGYYEWTARQVERPQRYRHDEILTTKIKNISYESMRRYGARKIIRLLRREGWIVNRKRVRRLRTR